MNFWKVQRYLLVLKGFLVGLQKKNLDLKINMDDWNSYNLWNLFLPSTGVFLDVNEESSQVKGQAKGLGSVGFVPLKAEIWMVDMGFHRHRTRYGATDLLCPKAGGEISAVRPEDQISESSGGFMVEWPHMERYGTLGSIRYICQVDDVQERLNASGGFFHGDDINVNAFEKGGVWHS